MNKYLAYERIVAAAKMIDLKKGEYSCIALGITCAPKGRYYDDSSKAISLFLDLYDVDFDDNGEKFGIPYKESVEDVDARNHRVIALLLMAEMVVTGDLEV